jgi:hypothetical protein
VKKNLNYIAYILIALILLGSATFIGVKIYREKLLKKQQAHLQAVKAEVKDVYADFAAEVYDTITQNYWEKITDQDLSNLFLLASQKVASTTPLTLASPNKTGVEKLVIVATNGKTADEKKDIVSNIADVVLANLKPFGRSRLYTQKEETILQNEVNNVDTSKNMYEILEVSKTATQAEIDKGYKTQKNKFAGQNTAKAKEQLALVERAYETLKTPVRRQIYDQTGSEPSVLYKKLSADTFYVKFVRFTPTLIPEFQAAAKTVDNEPQTLHTLILDLRDNIGGAIDQLPYLLGPFVGQGQYAFSFFHQGEYTPYQTATGFIPELVRYKRVIVLINGQTQSSAEVMAGTLKKFNVGILVGSPTRGWGTIERVFPLKTVLDPKQSFSAFLVHTLTLADDNQPIEGRGVIPQINISNKNWQTELNAYYNDPGLAAEVKSLFK